jgi:hypothetical protein
LSLGFHSAPLQRRNLAPVCRGGLLEGGSLAPNLFASDAGDLFFKNRCNVWHDVKLWIDKVVMLERLGDDSQAGNLSWDKGIRRLLERSAQSIDRYWALGRWGPRLF